jgi:hypothetical protein
VGFWKDRDWSERKVHRSSERQGGRGWVVPAMARVWRRQVRALPPVRSWRGSEGGLGWGLSGWQLQKSKERMKRGRIARMSQI